MKYTIAILCRDQLYRTDVSIFIQQQRGRIKDDGNQIGLIHTAEGTVWIFFDEVEEERDSTMELAGEKIVERLGGPYSSSITLVASSAPGSAVLITDLAIACCERWAPAFAYDCAGTLFSQDEIVRLRAEGRNFLDLWQ